MNQVEKLIEAARLLALETKAIILLESLPEGSNTQLYELDEVALCEEMVEDELLRKWQPLESDVDWYVTTEKGRDWLITYANGGHR